MQYAGVDDIASETKLLRPVAEFEFRQIREIVRRGHSDLRDRGHPKQRTRPQEAIASARIRVGVQRQEFQSGLAQQDRSIVLVAGPQPARQEVDLLLLQRRQALEKPKQFLERVGL